MELRGSGALVLFGAACVLSSLVAWSFSDYAPASARAPALALYAPPASGLLRPVGVPAGVVPPATPMYSPATPAMMNPTAQMPIGQPSMDTVPQIVPLAAAPGMGPLQGFFWGLSASFAVGFAIMAKKINENGKALDGRPITGMAPAAATLLSEPEDVLELGMLPRRAGVPAMQAVAEADADATPPAPAAVDVTKLPGISTEVGKKLWDPLKLSANMDQSNLNLIRAAELKHGRVAMLANVGWCVAVSGGHLPGMLSGIGWLSSEKGLAFADIAAAGDPLKQGALVPAIGIWQIILSIGHWEVMNERKYPSTKYAGNLGWKGFLYPEDPEKLKRYEEVELKHGRLAMLGIISYACAVAVPGSVPLYPYWF